MTRTTRCTCDYEHIALRKDHDNYVSELARLHNLLAEMYGTVTGRNFTNVVLHCLSEKYRDINLTSWKDPDFDLPMIQSVPARAVAQQDEYNRWAWHDQDSSDTSASDPDSIICRNCGKSGRYKSGYAGKNKVHGKRTTP